MKHFPVGVGRFSESGLCSIRHWAKATPLQYSLSGTTKTFRVPPIPKATVYNYCPQVIFSEVSIPVPDRPHLTVTSLLCTARPPLPRLLRTVQTSSPDMGNIEQVWPLPPECIVGSLERVWVESVSCIETGFFCWNFIPYWQSRVDHLILLHFLARYLNLIWSNWGLCSGEKKSRENVTESGHAREFLEREKLATLIQC